MSATPADTPVDELLAAAYAVDGPDANRQLYARWADTYDSGFIVDSGYQYHEQVAAVFAEHALDAVGPADAVVDVGCGTGLAGCALRQHGPVVIDGIDLSPEMLGRAATKQHEGEAVYRQLIVVDLTQPLPIDAGTYAAALSVGTFTHGHVGPDALARAIGIVRPGGRAAFGINAAHFASAGFGTAFEKLVRTGEIDDLRLVDVPIYADADMDDPDQFAHVAVFTIA